jgi:hypothetical protein
VPPADAAAVPAEVATPSGAPQQEEDEFLVGDRARPKREHRRLVRDPVTGELVAEQRRKRSRRRPDWEEDVGRWSEEDLHAMMDFTEADFLGDEAELDEEDSEEPVVYSTVSEETSTEDVSTEPDEERRESDADEGAGDESSAVEE